MTPKEKAVELIDKFTYWNTAEAEREGIKSALSCVNEILIITYSYSGNEYEFYQEVKNEINKL